MDEKVNVQEVDAERAFSKGYLVVFRATKWGASAKVDESKLGEDLPKEIYRAIQDLLEDKEELQALNTVKNTAKAFIKAHALPFPIPSFEFIPGDTVWDNGEMRSRLLVVNDRLKKLAAEYFEIVDSFMDRYPTKVAEYATKYPEHYRADKYPTEAKLRNMFSFGWSFKRFKGPDEELRDISPEIYEAEAKKVKAEIQEMKDMTVQLVRAEMVKRIDSLKEQCVDGRLNVATVNGIQGFLEKFETLWDNFVDVGNIRNLIAEVKEYMDDTDVDMLRADDEFREVVGAKMAEVSTALQSIQDKPKKRKFIL